MFNFFKKKKEPENFEELLVRFKKLEKDFEKLSFEIKKLRKENKFNIQKVAIVRFNPFKEVGGDQSFSLVLLDGTDSGVVITSLYTREENRVYGKPIKNGQSNYSLSEEEKEALKKAIGNKNEEKNNKKNNIKPRKRDNEATSGGSFRSY